MRVLGIDPGLTRCGIGVIEGQLGKPVQLIDVGVITTPPDLEHSRRLLRIDEGIAEWIDRFHPDVISVERVFADLNVKTVTGVAQAVGFAMVNAARRGIPIYQHTPTEVKAAITGSGKADKAQVGHMVARILKLSAPPKPADAADAVALAICHLWRGAAESRYAAAIAKQARITA